MKISSGVLASLIAAGSLTGCATSQLLTPKEKAELRKEPVKREGEASEPSEPAKPTGQNKVDECFACGMG